MNKHYCPHCDEYQAEQYLDKGACGNCGQQTFPAVSFSFMWSDQLGAEIKRRSLTPHPIECHQGADWYAIAAAINQGIDSHLEAIQYTRTIGSHGRERVVFNPESIPALVRRLMESGEENAESLASGICETLGIELI